MVETLEVTLPLQQVAARVIVLQADHLVFRLGIAQHDEVIVRARLPRSGVPAQVVIGPGRMRGANSIATARPIATRAPFVDAYPVK